MRFGLRTFERILRVVLRAGIKLVSFFDHRLYMALYNRYLRWVGVNMRGRARYISSSAKIDGADFGLVTIGDGAVISSGVRILTHDFSIDRVASTTSDFADVEVYVARPVLIGANAFVGAGSILLPGACVGDRAIVGAGSVVRGEVPEGAVVIGNPAQIVGEAEILASRHLRKWEAADSSVRRIRR